MLDPIIKTIEVPCNQAMAFSVFVDQMGSWWPLDKRSMSLYGEGGKPAKSLQVDAQVGGKIIEIGPDETEYHWGTITTYDPNDLLRMDFHMGLPAENASLVEVRFSAVGDAMTRVELKHSNWEAFGDRAEMMRGGYGSGWVIIFEEAYRAACGGS